MGDQYRFTARYSGTFHFFPALLPLVELAPLLLAFLGGVSGAAKWFTPTFWKKHRRVFIVTSLVFIGTAIFIYVQRMPARETSIAGTRVIEEKDWGVPVYFAKTEIPPPVALRQFGEIWSMGTKSQILSTPVIASNLLIYGAYGKTVEAVSLVDGNRVWSLPHAASVLSLSGGGDVVYSGEGLHFDQSASLTAINAADGTIRWRREFLGHLEESVTKDDASGMLWLGTGPGGLWALDSKNGRVKWHQAIGHVDSEPLLQGGILYVPAQVDENTHETLFHALDAKSGKIIWTLPQPGQPWGSPAMDKTGKIILTTTGIGQIGVARETDKGWAQGLSVDGKYKLLWEVALPSTPVSPGVYVPEADLIIHTAKNGEIVALNVANGSLAWQAKGGNEFHSAAAFIDGYDVPMIATTSYEGVFTIRNALTGQEMVRRMVGTGVNSSPVVSGDIVYVSSAYKITAFGGLSSLGGQK